MFGKSKTSKYNICLPVGDKAGHWLIFNGGKGSFCLVNEELGTLLDRADKDDRILPPVDERTYNFLMSKGLLDYDNQEDAQIADLCSKQHCLNCDHITMSIVPSFNCNFNCDYCFEKAIWKEQQEKLKKVMSREMLDAVFAQTEAFRAEGKRITHFVFFGGEPFLPANKDIVAYACEKCDKAGIPVSVITNGYYLDEYLDLIAKYNFVAVKITIDGPKEVHNARRAPAGTVGSFDRIVKNTLAALKTGKTITFRTNVNQENSWVIPCMKEEYERLGLMKYPNFSYYFGATMSSFEREENIFSHVQVMEQIGKGCSNYKYNSAYARVYKRLLPFMKGEKYMELKPEFCVAHSSRYTVDPFGNVYTCWNSMHNPNAVVASVDTEKGRFVYNENFVRWNNRTVDKIEKCRNCKYMMFCGGGCAAQSMESKGDMMEAYCDCFPEVFNQVAVQIAKEELKSFLEEFESSRPR